MRGEDARGRRVVQLCGSGGAGSGGSPAAGDPGAGGRGPGGIVGGFRASLFAHRPAFDRAGEAVAGAFVAGLLHHPFGAPADGAAGLQPFVPLVRRAFDGRARVGRDGVFEEPRPSGGGRCGGALPPGGAARRAGSPAVVGRAFLGRRHADRGLGVDEELPPQGRRRRRSARRAQRRTGLPRRAALERDPRVHHRWRRPAVPQGRRPVEPAVATWAIC